MPVESSIKLCRATPADARLVFQWRNDPFVIEHSSSRSTVEWEEHSAWFEKTLASNDRLVFIVSIGGQAAGLVRFDREDEAQCVISAYLTKPWVGRGLGVPAIRRACERVFEEWSVRSIIACVLHSNPKGYRAFCSAGFSELDSGVCPEGHFCLARTRDEATTSSNT